jgi:glutaredoxin 2
MEKSRDPSLGQAAKQRQKRDEESTKKTNLIEKKKARFKALQESARGEGSAKTSPMRTERAFDKFRSPRNAKEYFADKPGSKYEGMAKENLEEQTKAIETVKVWQKVEEVKHGSKGVSAIKVKNAYGKNS